MSNEVKKQIEKLDNRRAEILFILCEENHVSHPDILIGLIHEIRGITKLLKILRKNKAR